MADDSLSFPKIGKSNANSIKKYETEKNSIAVPTRLHDIMKNQAYGLTTFARNLLIIDKPIVIV